MCMVNIKDQQLLSIFVFGGSQNPILSRFDIITCVSDRLLCISAIFICIFICKTDDIKFGAISGLNRFKNNGLCVVDNHSITLFKCEVKQK